MADQSPVRATAAVPTVDPRDFWIDYPDEDWYGKVYCPRCKQVACHANDSASLGDLIDAVSQHACREETAR